MKQPSISATALAATVRRSLRSAASSSLTSRIRNPLWPSREDTCRSCRRKANANELRRVPTGYVQCCSASAPLHLWSMSALFYRRRSREAGCGLTARVYDGEDRRRAGGPAAHPTACRRSRTFGGGTRGSPRRSIPRLDSRSRLHAKLATDQCGRASVPVIRSR
jgi:hypothetical protein